MERVRSVGEPPMIAGMTLEPQARDEGPSADAAQDSREQAVWTAVGAAEKRPEWTPGAVQALAEFDARYLISTEAPASSSWALI